MTISIAQQRFLMFNILFYMVLGHSCDIVGTAHIVTFGGGCPPWRDDGLRSRYTRHVWFNGSRIVPGVQCIVQLGSLIIHLLLLALWAASTSGSRRPALRSAGFLTHHVECDPSNWLGKPSNIRIYSVCILL